MSHHHLAFKLLNCFKSNTNYDTEWASGGEQEQADWTETNTDSPSYIQHKPDLSVYATQQYVNGKVQSEATRATGVEQALQTALDIIEAVIPSAASSSNQLADKNFVNSSISTNTATFVGTYNSLAELEATTGNHHNDYAWVKVTDSDGDNDYDRYKYNGSAWVFEYRLNNTHFTAAELDAIRSGMTTEKREKLDNLPPATSSSIAATTGAATISGSKKFFVGTQGQDGRWTLESLTPAEMQKCAYAYLAGATVGTSPAHLQGTDASGNPQRITPSDLASLLGVEKGSFTGSKTFPNSSCGILMLVEGGGGRSVGCYLFDAFTVKTIKDVSDFIESLNVSNYKLTVTGKQPTSVYNYTWIRTYQT